MLFHFYTTLIPGKPGNVVGYAHQTQTAETTTELKKVEDNSEDIRCQSGLTATFYHIFNGITTDWNSWTYKEQAVCPYVLANRTTFMKRSSVLNIHCQQKQAQIEVFTSVLAANNAQAMPFGSSCFDAHIRACCKMDQMSVPKIIHYIWYGNKNEFSFYKLF